MKIHPIRATLAVSGWLATIILLMFGVNPPEAWWVIVTAVSAFYFSTTKEND